MTIDKSIRYEDLPKLNGNVIDITPLIRDEWWKIKEKLEEETNGEKETKIINLASAPHPDESWFSLWEDLDGQGIVPLGIKTLTDFKNWFHKQDLDVELFSRGGIASLMQAKRR
jgi:hypothetical protein